MEEFLNKVMDLSMESAKGIMSQMDHIYAAKPDAVPAPPAKNP